MQPVAPHLRVEPSPERILRVIEQRHLPALEADLETAAAAARHHPGILASKRTAEHVTQLPHEALLLRPNEHS
ncbi:MAG: hypothetical protein HYY39_00605 [Armatimonadetes bacterium]|nr:hypothetical protein [Armatimonadota bacterium]